MTTSITKDTDLAARRQDTGRAGDKRYQVVVYAPEIGETLGILGGKRAARAEAALVAVWQHQVDRGAEVGVYGLRGSFTAAQAEAARLVRGGKHRTPALWASVVPVTDE